MIQRFIVVLVCTLMLAACGGGTASEPATTPVVATDVPVAAATTAPTEASEVEPTAETVVEPTTAATEAPAEASGAETTPSDVQRYVIVPEDSRVQYSVDETFFRGGTRLATAVGVTQVITGEVMLDQQNPQNSTISPLQIDISAFTSDEDRRDQAIRERWLESARFPIARFEPTAITELPETYTEGEEFTIQVTGDLTVRETTRPVTFDVTGQVENGVLTGTATTDIKMSDFGFEPPNIADVLRAEDDVQLTFDFVARPPA